MKSQKGISLVSLLIYLLAMTITVTIIARISTYFYKNLKEVNDDTMASAEFIRFNSYFTKEINTSKNYVSEVSEDNRSITFGVTNNKFVFVGNEIYMNDILICSGIQECYFDIGNSNEVSVTMIIDNNTYSNKYYIY